MTIKLVCRGLLVDGRECGRLLAERLNDGTWLLKPDGRIYLVRQLLAVKCSRVGCGHVTRPRPEPRTSADTGARMIDLVGEYL